MFLHKNDTFKLQITLDRHNLRLNLYDYLLPDPPHFSLPSTRYGVEKLGVTRYEAKIKCGNAASLRLFQERLDFQEVSRSHVFQAGAPHESAFFAVFRIHRIYMFCASRIRIH
jgi:hypothetical protein